MPKYQRIAWKWIRRVVGVLLLIVVAYLILAPTGRYLVRAALAEGRILARRRQITEIIADSAISARTAAKLRLVLAARAFAADSVDLRRTRKAGLRE